MKGPGPQTNSDAADQGRNQAAICGTVGTPCTLSILRSVLARGTGRVALLYANRDERSVIFRDALHELARAHPERLQVQHWLDTVQGVPTVPRAHQRPRPAPAARARPRPPGPSMRH
ncbi:MAG: hypothetical protein ACKOD9_10750, partial [Rubrivivax sp.]